MKKPILKCILAISCFAAPEAWAQDENPQKWKFGINISPEIGYRHLTADKGSEQYVYNIMKYRNQTEKNSPVFTAGLSAERVLGKGFSLRSGLQYSLRGENSTGIAMYIGGPEEKFRMKAQYHYIGVPINVSYHFLKREKISFFVNAGVDLNFFYMTSRFMTITDANGNESSDFDSHLMSKEDLNGYHVFSPTATLSFGMDIAVGKRSTIRIEPNFKYSFRSLADAPINGYYYNAGVNVGYLFRF